MQVEIRQDGKTLPLIHHKDRKYIEVPKNGPYQIRLYNNTPNRVQAVISVDGVNVVDGKDAGFTGGGYILSPWQRVEIPGWYRDGEKAASFSFEDKEESYSNQTGRGSSNVGIIGVAVFAERQWINVIPPPSTEHHHHHYHHNWGSAIPMYSGDWYTVTSSTSGGDGRLAANNAGAEEISVRSCVSAKGPQPRRMVRRQQKDVGTAYGSEVSFHTTQVEFQAEDSPSEVIEIRYAVRETLKRWGVPLEDSPIAEPSSAFPMSSGGVPAPPGWRG